MNCRGVGPRDDRLGQNPTPNVMACEAVNGRVVVRMGYPLVGTKVLVQWPVLPTGNFTPASRSVRSRLLSSNLNRISHPDVPQTLIA